MIIFNKLTKFIILNVFFSLTFFVCCEKDTISNPLESGDNIADPFVRNQLLYRSINLGNALEAPNEGEWGVTLQADYFKVINEAGFTGVRIPIRWSAHASESPPFAIDQSFLSRVDWAIQQALNNELAVVINMHHYEEMMIDPEGQKDRLYAIWEQIAEHYQTLPNSVIFELLNEPNDQFTSELWNQIAAELITIIRKTNPNRTLMIGTAEWGGLSALNDLVVPVADTNLIVTVHYYEPFHFTHQGAEWVSGSDQWLGTKWSGKQQEQLAIIQDLERVRQWSEAHNRPIFLGEFGAYSKADMASRYAWTSFVAREAERRDFSWAYWEFCSGFGIYDSQTKKFNELLQALIP